MVPYLSRIEGPPPKRNVARSNRAGIAKKSPLLKQKAANSSLLTKAGAFLFQQDTSANRFRGSVCRLPTFLPDF